MQLLATVYSGFKSKTLSFDESANHIAWLGTASHVKPEESIARIESVDEKVKLLAAKGLYLSLPEHENQVSLALEPSNEYNVAVQDSAGQIVGNVFIRQVNEGIQTFKKYEFSSDANLLIGQLPVCDISYQSLFVSRTHARLTRMMGKLYISDLGSTNGTYVNGIRIDSNQERVLIPGDVIEIMDLTIAVGNSFISVNAPVGVTITANESFRSLPHEIVRKTYRNPDIADKNPRLFYPAPSLSRKIQPLSIKVETPPRGKTKDTTSVLVQIGPSFLMAISAVFMAANTMARVSDGAEVLSIASSLVMSVNMVAGSLLWPVVTRRAKKKQDESAELNRQSTYIKYLNGIEEQLKEATIEQRRILEERRRPVMEFLGRANSQSPTLMSRTSSQENFLELRIGIGDEELVADVDWPKKSITQEDDSLWDAVDDLSARSLILHDVPVALDLSMEYIAGILGERSYAWAFLRGLLVQVCAQYSYQDVQVILIGDEDIYEEWEFLTHLEHFYDPTGLLRRVALSYEGLVQVDLLIERELEDRKHERVDDLGDYGVYYIVICANQMLAKRSEGVARLLSQKKNLGFSLLYLGVNISELPRECAFIIDLDNKRGATKAANPIAQSAEKPRRASMFARADMLGSKVDFDPDVMISPAQAHEFALSLAHLRLDTPEQHAAIPDSLGFLEMFEVGNIEHLNIGQRWIDNDASQSLQTIVGSGSSGDPVMLNLHESIHGPHGLIAGTTGSGKSEFIITYILSMCVNYAPDEVSFVLIDYKGGGLSRAFDNEHHHLPHLSGTITNLDGGEIRRSLVSIKSELKRRQNLFNEARNITGEATIDIYKYLSLYRQGILTEPLPHLIIVADEFAELKQQEPDFMDELISAARIGRSLGVHLILATQKPSGVVNDQIWSNARFKVALKVSDAADSREMIRREDAAEITQPGRFFMLVGYNESIEEGQAAYAGGQYAPADDFEPTRDNAVELLDSEGHSLTYLRPQQDRRSTGISELNAILSAIERSAEIVEKRASRLWLDPLPTLLPMERLWERYGRPNNSLTCVIGESDDPERQMKHLVTLDFAKFNNCMIAGAAGRGKTSLVQNILMQLCSSNSPEKVNLYILDYSSRLLGAFCELPHCGAVLTDADEEYIGPFFSLLDELVKERKQTFAKLGVADYESAIRSTMIPLVIVVIDNFAGLASSKQGERYAYDFDKYLKIGSQYGIRYLVTCSHVNEVNVRARREMDMRVALRLEDKYEYYDALNIRVDNVPQNIPGRGLCVVDNAALEMQVGYLAESLDSLRYNDLLIERINDIQTNWMTDSWAACIKRLPMIPRDIRYAEFCEQFDAGVFPLGFHLKDAKPVGLPYRQFTGMAMYFGSEASELPVLDCICHFAYCEHARVVFIKKSQGSHIGALKELRPDIAFDVIEPDENSLVDLVERVAMEMQRRQADYKECFPGKDPKTYRLSYFRQSTDPWLFVFEEFGAMNNASEDVQTQLCQVLPILSQFNMYAIGCFYPSDSYAVGDSLLLQALKKDDLTLLFGGRYSDQKCTKLPDEYYRATSEGAFNKFLMKYRGKQYPGLIPCERIDSISSSQEDKSIFE